MKALALILMVALVSCSVPSKTYIQKSIVQADGSIKPLEPKRIWTVKPGDTLLVVTKTH